MPYISEEKREVLDPVVEDLIQAFRGLQSDDPLDNPKSNLNYVISRLLDRMYTSNYQEIVNAVGTLATTAFEYYRRVAAPYENQKRHDHGDVYTVDTVHTAVKEHISDNADK